MASLVLFCDTLILYILNGHPCPILCHAYIVYFKWPALSYFVSRLYFLKNYAKCTHIYEVLSHFPFNFMNKFLCWSDPLEHSLSWATMTAQHVNMCSRNIWPRTHVGSLSQRSDNRTFFSFFLSLNSNEIGFNFRPSWFDWISNSEIVRINTTLSF